MKTSKIIIGCMSWGIWGKNFTEKEKIDLIEFCTHHGNTTFDHADIYGDYSTEGSFGKAFIKSGIARNAIQLISKCGIQLEGGSRKNQVKHYQYDKNYILKSAHNSLKNFKTDYLDTFLLHRPSPLMHPDEIAEAITLLKKDGKILNFGVSNFTSSQVALIESRVAVEVNQIEFSLSQHTAMQNGCLDYLIQKNIKPMCWSPLGTVFKEQSKQSVRIQKVLNNLSEKYKVSSDVLLLAWIIKHPANIYPIIGTTNKERIINANSALQVDLELQDWFLLLEASTGNCVP